MGIGDGESWNTPVVSWRPSRTPGHTCSVPVILNGANERELAACETRRSFSTLLTCDDDLRSLVVSQPLEDQGFSSTP